MQPCSLLGFRGGSDGGGAVGADDVVAFVVALFAAIQTLDGFVFQPRIVGRASHLHPLAVIAAIVVGAQFGLVGLILALPLACVARVLLLELWWGPHVARKEALAKGVKT